MSLLYQNSRVHNKGVSAMRNKIKHMMERYSMKWRLAQCMLSVGSHFENSIWFSGHKLVPVKVNSTKEVV